MSLSVCCDKIYRNKKAKAPRQPNLRKGKSGTVKLTPAMRFSVAMHEAAHAVVGVRLGLKLISVNIRGSYSHDCNSHPICIAGSVALEQEQCEELMKTPSGIHLLGVVAAAGIMAQSLMNDDPAGASADVAFIQRIVQDSMGGARDDELTLGLTVSFMQAADAILNRDRRQAWYQVAAALLIAGSLSHADVEELVNDTRAAA